MDKLKIIIAEDGKEYVEMMKAFFQDKKDVDIIGCYEDGEKRRIIIFNQKT